MIFLVHVGRFLQITVREFISDRLVLKAMALTFVTLLSLIPLLVISFSLFRLFGGGEWYAEAVRPLILQYLAPGSGPTVVERLQEVIESAGSTTLGGIGLLLLVVAVYAIFAGIESTFNTIWGVTSRAGALHRLPLYWGLVTIIPILVIGSVALTTYIQALPLVERTVQEAVRRVDFVQSYYSRLMPGLMVIVGFFLLYRFVPSTRVRNRFALAGAVFAGILFEIVKAGFIFYTGKLVKYDLIYGSLAVVPLLMVWVNLGWIVVLAGVEFCFVAQHYNMLLTKPKHVVFSRAQEDALAYLVLIETTRAFRGRREEVDLEEWTERFGIPPGIVEQTVNQLVKGGFIQRGGQGGKVIIIARDPEKITIDGIDSLLSGDSSKEWKWPKDPPWKRIEEWMAKRNKAQFRASTFKNLQQFVENIDSETEKRVVESKRKSQGSR